MSFDAIIFDMDGVVLDSEKYWPEMDHQLLPALIPDFDPEHFPPFLGVGSKHIYEMLAQQYELDFDEATFIEQRYSAAIEYVYEKTQLMPGFLDFVTTQKRTYKIALGTSAPQFLVDHIFERLGLHEYFDAIATPDDTDGVGKPQPDIFLAASKKLNRAPEKCLVIEDADAGIQAGKAAGMTVYAFRNGLNSHQLLAQADRIFTDYSEIEL